MTLQATLAAFLNAATTGGSDDAQLKGLGQQLAAVARGAPPEVLGQVLTQVIGLFDAPRPAVQGFSAFVCGCLVEAGADAAALVPALLPAVERALSSAAPALEAVSTLPEAETEDEETQTVELGERRIGARDWQALREAEPSSTEFLLELDSFCLPLISALTRQPSLLKTAPVQALLPRATAASSTSQYAYFLARLLRVPMEEEWLIVDPAHVRGFALRVSGVANAFQVYSLTHSALLRVPRSFVRWSRAVPGPGPSVEVLSVAEGEGPQHLSGSYTPTFTLYRWTALREAGYIPNLNDYRDWYSSSAVPAELSRFKGTRVGVLGDASLRMNFSIAREFEALKARVTLLRELERRHVVELIHGFARAEHPGHPEPGVGWA